MVLTKRFINKVYIPTVKVGCLQLQLNPYDNACFNNMSIDLSKKQICLEKWSALIY